MTDARGAFRGAALTLAVLCGVEMAMREIARRSLFHLVLGATPPVWLMVALPAVLVLFARRPAAVLIPLFSLGVAVQMHLGARLQSDGFYYFAYLRSMAFDGDVDFTNDYRMLGLGNKTNLFAPTPTGHAQSAWTIGPAIVWSPFFAVGHLVAKRLHGSGADVSVDGTSFPYRQAICIAGLFYGLLGCWFCYRLTKRIRPPPLATTAVVLTICGSFMLWYLIAEPTMTHAPSMAAVAGFVWLWLATRNGRSLLSWALLGVLAGLMAMIRWQNALFMLLPGIDAARMLLRPSTPRARADAITGSAVFLACAVAAFLPQMLAWKAIYGSYIARSPVGPEIRWTHPRVIDVLFSARNGLLSTSPLLYLGAIGLVLLAVEDPALALPCVAAVALMAYFNGCIQDWWGSAGFGGRRFDGTIPLLCLGLAVFIDVAVRVVRRHTLAAIVAALAILAVWNLALIQAAHEGTVRIGETLAFDRAWAIQSRVVHGWFGNPFTYPASLAFALRNGVGLGEYDLLSTDRFLGDPHQAYARVDIGTGDDWIIGDGWHAPEQEGAASFRWAEQQATIRLPLDHAAALRVQVRLHAFAYPGAPPQTVTISANGVPVDASASHACALVPVPADWQTVECTVDASSWRSGVNHVLLAFAYAARPIDVGLGDDQRRLSAAVDWVRVLVTAPDTGR
jgi:hypothetical protein